MIRNDIQNIDHNVSIIHRVKTSEEEATKKCEHFLNVCGDQKLVPSLPWIELCVFFFQQ